MKRVLVVSSDPGVTRALVPVVREFIKRKVHVHIVASGPAIPIWQCTRIPCDYVVLKDSINEIDAIHVIKSYQPNIVVTGAGAYNRIEHTFRRVASSQGIFCFALLDFWANYHLRFRREFDGRVILSLPDLIGVMDEICYNDMIADGFEPDRLVIVGAPLLEESVKFLNSVSEAEIESWRNQYKLKKDILTFAFFSQTMPLSLSNNVYIEQYSEKKLPPWGFTQITILREVVNALSIVCNETGVRAQLVIKPHPMECGSFEYVYQTSGLSPLIDCFIVKDTNSPALISVADVILGMSSTALLEAGLAGKDTLSIQIGRDIENCPDNFYGNRIGITKPIYEVTHLRKALREILCPSKHKEIIPVKQNFDHSTTKVVEVILENANKHRKHYAITD